MKYISNPVNKVSFWLLDVLKQMQKRIMSVIFVLLVYFMLWYVPQVNDLIIVVNQTSNHWIAVPMFFVALTVFAFFVSVAGDYFDPPVQPDLEVMEADSPQQQQLKVFRVPKDAKEIYLEEKQKGMGVSSTFQESQSDYIRRVFPKMLGSLLIFSAAFAVNNTFQTVYGHDIIFTGNWGFLIVIIFMLLSLNQKITQTVLSWLRRWKWMGKYGPVILVGICSILIIFLGFLNRGGTEGDSVRLFYALMLLAVLFLLLSFSYNKFVLWFKKHIGARLTILFIVVTLVSYLILAVHPRALEVYTPLSIIMICLIGIYTIFNLIKILGRRINVPLLGIVLLLSVVLGVYNANKNNFNHYDASYTTNITNTPEDRLPIEEYIDRWIEDRRSLIQNQAPGEQFPIILVSAEGGGSRAGLWSFLVQSYLFDKDPDYFRKYLFSMTGASGGGGGNNMFYAQAYRLLEDPSALPLKYEDANGGFQYRASTIYNKDYLSASVASIMGRDLFKSITNIGTFEDRGGLLELQWEDQFNATFETEKDNPLGQAYLNLMPQKDKHQYIRPIIITNATELQSGERAIMSPVKNAGDPHRLGVFTDLLKAYPDPKRMIKRSTAMSMNARFPYLSPAARIDGVGQFGDAGYYNNIGGNVTIALERSLREALEKDTTLTGKYKIKQLLITNHTNPPAEITYSSQMLAPLSMIANATFAHPKQSERTLQDVINVQSKRTPIPQQASMMDFVRKFAEEEGEDIEPIIPLGRYLSEAAVRSMEARLKEQKVQAQLDRLLSPN